MPWFLSPSFHKKAEVKPRKTKARMREHTTYGSAPSPRQHEQVLLTAGDLESSGTDDAVVAATDSSLKKSFAASLLCCLALTGIVYTAGFLSGRQSTMMMDSLHAKTDDGSTTAATPTSLLGLSQQTGVQDMEASGTASEEDEEDDDGVNDDNEDETSLSSTKQKEGLAYLLRKRWQQQMKERGGKIGRLANLEPGSNAFKRLAAKLQMRKSFSGFHAESKPMSAYKSLTAMSKAMSQMAGLAATCMSAEGCSGAKVSSTVFGVCATVAPTIGAAFPPLGLGLEIVGDIGVFISSFFFSGKPANSKPPPLTIQAIQRAVMKELKIEVLERENDYLAAVRDIMETDIQHAASVIASIGYAQKYAKDPQEAQSLTDYLVRDWKQGFDLSFPVEYEEAMIRMIEDYHTVFGSQTYTTRYKMIEWLSDCDKNCNMKNNEGSGTKNGAYGGQIQENQAELWKICKKQVNASKKAWSTMQTASKAFRLAAATMFSYTSILTAVFRYASNCNTTNFKDFWSNCEFAGMIDHIASRQQTLQMIAHRLSTTLETFQSKCSSNPYWPFDQCCGKDHSECPHLVGKKQSCNYKYLLTLSNKEWTEHWNLNGANGDPLQIIHADQSFHGSFGDTIKGCQNFVNLSDDVGADKGFFPYFTMAPAHNRSSRNLTSYGTGEWTNFCDKSFHQTKSVDGCASSWWAVALPSMCLDTFCNDLFVNDTFWFPDFNNAVYE